MPVEKNSRLAGADERTPSRSEYFSWINNTNEGSTEAQTLINLDYFAYLKRKYNMKLDIYAWDAGNLDGSEGTYQTFDSPKLKSQYPNGYGPIVAAAREIGCRLGVWGGADGFGDTEESAAARIEQMVSLARDYNFALFKFDTVCGQLAPDHEKYFIKMMQDCRKYSPDLILLNHRLPLSPEAEQYATTFLWEGLETYVDVHVSNQMTAPHHRAFIMSRGQTPDLCRLTEDHGVCLSSNLDFFEDDLIIQAFSRNLILAPEIYGNPWFLRDDEQARLARIFNLHRRYRDILVDGMLLPKGDNYPDGTIVRGNLTKRFIATANIAWKDFDMKISLDLSIGLAPCDKVSVIIHHPYEKFVGKFNWGEKVTIPVKSFRASLVEICDSREADVMLSGCEYEVLHEDESGKIDRINIVSSTGEVAYTDGKVFDTVPAFDITLRSPKMLGGIDADVVLPVRDDSNAQLEAALFSQDHDSLEKRCIDRSGETNIPEVKAARDAFFAQETYKIRGCENRFAFDGCDDTYFDGVSKIFYYEDGFRMDGGCLRVDLGDVYDADYIYFEYFDSDITETGYFAGVVQQKVPAVCDFSRDLDNWKDTYIDEVHTIRPEEKDILVASVHSIKKVMGKRKYVTYPIGGEIRYFRMPRPLDRIHKIAIFKDGEEIALTAPHANNILPYGRKVSYTKEFNVKVAGEDFRDGCYMTVCLEGWHEVEAAYAVLECDGKLYTAPDRTPSYQSNVWEFVVRPSMVQEHHYSYYFPITKEMCDRDITVRVLGIDEKSTNYAVTAYLCDKNDKLLGVEADI